MQMLPALGWSIKVLGSHNSLPSHPPDDNECGTDNETNIPVSGKYDELW